MVGRLFSLARLEKGGVKSSIDMREEMRLAIDIDRGISMCQERPYQHDSTASRLLSEVKHVRARLVLRWGTTLESWVLFFFYFW
jgi:hypothetical protein